MAEERHPGFMIPYIDDDGSAAAMRAEAASRSQSLNNWMLAALITTNGGGILTLLNQPIRGWPIIVALVIYLLGVTAALVAGRQAAVLAHETEALFISLLAETRATRALTKATELGNPSMWKIVNEHVEARRADAQTARAEFEKVLSPDVALGCGLLFFFVASVFAGIGLL